MIPRPFFSVIIPTFNRADLILKTLDSVFSQTFQDYEIIVVDNCSTDRTSEVLQPLADKEKIRFIKHQVNLERAVSRNTGLEATKGRFATFLDSDDIMYPENLADAYAFARQHPGVHVFHNRYQLIDETGKPIYQYHFPSLRNPVKAIAEGNFMSCIGGFISEEVYSNYRFDTAVVLQGIEDWEFWMRVFSRYPIQRINRINSAIVHHKGRSITSYTLASYIHKMEYVAGKVESDPELLKVYAPYLDSFRVSCLMLAASMANSASLFDQAKNYLRQALVIKASLLFKFRFHRILLKSMLTIRSTIDE